MKKFQHLMVSFWNIKSTILLFLFPNLLFAQADLTTGGYFQDFGSSTISWTNGASSGTMKGWYYTQANRGNANIITSTNANSFNSGGIYTYSCNGDQMIGSRASGSASNIYYGVRLKNTSGAPIVRIEVSFDWYQISLATNNNNTNTIAFSYQTGSTVTSLSGGTWTSVPSLNFSNTQNAGSGTTQLQWYAPCLPSEAETGYNAACIEVNIPVNGEIMLRWNDIDDSANDHHMGIDNVSVLAFDLEGGDCVSPLAIELLDFDGERKNDQARLFWSTQAEINNSHFTISRSTDGINWENIGRVTGAGTSTQSNNYELIDYTPKPGINYYKLESTDFDGTTYNKGIKALEWNQNHTYYNAITQSIELTNKTDVEIYSTDGKLLFKGEALQSVPFHHKGLFLIHFPLLGTSERKAIY